MNKQAKELVELINSAKDKGTKPYDTQATVVRIDGNTAWVHIPGGVDETPVQKTIDAHEGDTVIIRVSGGSAWITGNATSPPTDNKTAEVSLSMINEITELLNKAVKESNGDLAVIEEAIENLILRINFLQYEQPYSQTLPFFFYDAYGTHMTEEPDDATENIAITIKPNGGGVAITYNNSHVVEIDRNGSITSEGGITSVGNITSSEGDIRSEGDITSDSGNITASEGEVHGFTVTSEEDIESTNGDVKDGYGNILANKAEGVAVNLAVGKTLTITLSALQSLQVMSAGGSAAQHKGAWLVWGDNVAGAPEYLEQKASSSVTIGTGTNTFTITNNSVAKRISIISAEPINYSIT